MSDYDVTVQVTYRVPAASVETAMARARELIQFDLGAQIDLTTEGIVGNEIVAVVRR